MIFQKYQPPIPPINKGGVHTMEVLCVHSRNKNRKNIETHANTNHFTILKLFRRLNNITIRDKNKTYQNKLSKFRLTKKWIIRKLCGIAFFKKEK